MAVRRKNTACFAALIAAILVLSGGLFPVAPLSFAGPQQPAAVLSLPSVAVCTFSVSRLERPSSGGIRSLGRPGFDAVPCAAAELEIRPDAAQSLRYPKFRSASWRSARAVCPRAPPQLTLIAG